MTEELKTPNTVAEPPIISDDFASVHEALVNAEAALSPDKLKGQRRDVAAEELASLTLAIEIYPQAAANYAARGDHFRRRGERVLAVADYQQALTVAETELAQSRWGFVAQALRDRLLQTLLEMGEPL